MKTIEIVRELIKIGLNEVCDTSDLLNRIKGNKDK